MCTQNLCFEKKISLKYLKIIVFTAVKYCSILHERVFVMNSSLTWGLVVHHLRGTPAHHKRIFRYCRHARLCRSFPHSVESHCRISQNSLIHTYSGKHLFCRIFCSFLCPFMAYFHFFILFYEDYPSKI